jgi:glycosyltransferase involved in cell wall biosynthesis
MKTVLIDARMHGLAHAGIGRYIMNLVANLPKSSKGIKYQLIVAADQLGQIKKELGGFFEYIPARSKHYSIAEQFELPILILKANPDIVHFPHFNAPLLCPKKYLVTIHDLIKHYFRGEKTTTKNPILYWPKYFSYRVVSSLVIRRSKAIIVPSYWWKDKLSDDFGVPKNKINVTWEGVDDKFLSTKSVNQKKITQKYKLKNKQFFVYTGSVYPHKNIERLIKAFLNINRKEIILAIVCSRSIFSEKLEKTIRGLGAEKKIKFLGFVPDDELKAIYKSCLGLVQPSLMEGFGLTGLEAMASNCPVLSSNGSCLPEVYGDAAVYFDPKNTSEMTKVLEKVASDQSLRKSLIALGKKQLKKYSWQKTAKNTVRVYQSLFDDK